MTAEGSWHPDPTGRFKLRWQRSSGEWSHHVYDHDGNPHTDPYHASEPGPAKPRKRRRTWRWVLIAWGALAVILVMAALGSQIDDEEAAPTAVQTTTTTRPPATTTEEDLVAVMECLEWETADSVIVYEIGNALGEMAVAMAVSDVVMTHSWYRHAKTQRELLRFEEWLAECGHWNPDSSARAAADYEAAEEAWEGVERICRDALEPLGFAC